MLVTLSLRNLRSYASLEVALGPGPQLIWGPNAAGKTTLLEAVVLLAIGRSHRTSADAELTRWGADYLRVVGQVAPLPAGASGGSSGGGASAAGEPSSLEVSIPAGGRKRVLVNGVPRRPAALGAHLRTVLFAPEEMLLVIGSPGLRRAALDDLATAHDKMYATHMATYSRALAQRNGLLRQIREGEADSAQLRYWNEPFLSSGAEIVASRFRLLEAVSGPLAAAHAEIAPAEGRLTLSYASNAMPLPGESPRDALARRLGETAEKEVWNGSTLIGPHRDDLIFAIEGRDLSTFASRGQQRTAILALKLAELDLLTELDGRPPLLLLDDVFSELDPIRRGHLVRRIAALPQSLITTTVPEDLDPDLVRQARAWKVVPGDDGARLEEGAIE